MTASLPNIRKLFIPDVGYTIFDADLSGADAQVVAWEAGDEDLKAAFRRGENIHIKNARDMFPDKVKGWSDAAIKAAKAPGEIYYCTKRGVHGTNYVGSAYTLAGILGWTIHEAENFQRRWFGAHPLIRGWHNRIELALRTTRRVSFGYTRTYFDRIDSLLPQAVAWIPQSTVALVTFEAMIALHADLRALRTTQLLAQVHDSVVFQIKTDHVAAELPRIRQLFHITVPYPDPLMIPWGLAASTVSWGDCEARDWPSEPSAKPSANPPGVAA
jgi:DNA polymerase-1